MACLASNTIITTLGNRCDHDPGLPKQFVPPSTHNNFPRVIESARESLMRWYWNCHRMLGSLRKSRATNRQQRSERREAILAIGQILIQYCELSTLRVGIPNANGSFVSLSMKDIALKAGFRAAEDDRPREEGESLKDYKNRISCGIKRVWRAIKDLKEAGYLSVHRQFEKYLDEENEEHQIKYHGLPAIRCFDVSFFYELGISRQFLLHYRNQATSRLRKKMVKNQKEEKLKDLEENQAYYKKLSGGLGFKNAFNLSKRKVSKKEAAKKQREALEEIYRLDEFRNLHENKGKPDGDIIREFKILEGLKKEGMVI